MLSAGHRSFPPRVFGEAGNATCGWGRERLSSSVAGGRAVDEWLVIGNASDGTRIREAKEAEKPMDEAHSAAMLPSSARALCSGVSCAGFRAPMIVHCLELIDPEPVGIPHVQAEPLGELEKPWPRFVVTCLVNDHRRQHASTGAVLVRGDLPQQEEVPLIRGKEGNRPDTRGQVRVGDDWRARATSTSAALASPFALTHHSSG